jgi:hypothetical protein
MIHLDLLTGVARERRDELVRQAAAQRLVAAVRATRRQQEPDSKPVRWRRRFAASLRRHDARQCEAGAGGR